MDKRILSFDGGGIRGVISAAFLKALEKDTTVPISQNAEILAGTSTGSIIASALAVGMTPQDILEFYSSMSSEIFKPKHTLDSFLDLTAKYSDENLYNAIQKAFSSKNVDPQIPLSQLSKEIVIPTVCLDCQTLKRWRMQILTNNSETPLIDAMMESTAAPTFFPSYKNRIDGGMVANDPSAVAYAISGGAKALLSFGTGYTDYDVSKGEHWGALSWICDLNPRSKASKTPLLTLLFDVQDQMPGQLCQLLMGSKYCRVNLELTQSVQLDETSKIPSLIQETESYIRHHAAEWKALCAWTEKLFS